MQQRAAASDTAAGTLHTQRTVAGEHAGGRAPAWPRTLTPTRPRARAPALPVHAPACTAEGRVFPDRLPEKLTDAGWWPAVTQDEVLILTRDIMSVHSYRQK